MRRKIFSHGHTWLRTGGTSWSILHAFLVGGFKHGWIIVHFIFWDHFLESHVSLPEFNHQQMVVSIVMGDPQVRERMVYFMENPIDMDDLEVPPFYETSIYIYIYIYIYHL